MKRSVLSMALSGLLATAAVGVAGDASAMTVHVNGDRIFLSGDVTLADIVALPAMLAKAEAEGRPFREVVLRTSNGGALISGEWLQAVIRTAGLNTIVSGRCISSCSIMQSGGVERYMAGDLPTEVDSVQIHAASSGGRVTYGPSPRMFGIYTGNYGGGMDEGLLYKALFEVTQPNGLLVFADPARTSGDSVSFDPDGTGRAEETFPGQDMFNNNIMTSADYRNPGDTLRVTSNVTGDINPGYLRTGRLLQALVDDDFARWTDADYGTTYINLAVTLYNLAQNGPNGIGQFSLQDYLSDPGIQALLGSKLRLDQLDASALADSAGVISIGNGAVWRTAATTGADLMRVENGTIALEGGALRTTELRVQRAGALVSGYFGSVANGAAFADWLDTVLPACPDLRYCLDPVIGDTHTGPYVEPGLERIFAERLLPHAWLVTPNAFELGRLTGMPALRQDDAIAASRVLLERGPQWVIAHSVSGVPGELVTLAIGRDEVWRWASPHLPVDVAGTGDVLMSLLVAFLLKGHRFEDAVGRAIAGVHAALEATLAHGVEEFDVLAAAPAALGTPHRFRAERLA